ncbi:MAG: DUF87 domain-containing protein [Bacteroidia bacterium]|nr:DUF87 domain-containing protein [Bacteroidia bacterium]
MGTFKGFSERGFEFAAEIVTPYNASMLEKPQLGQFLLIELGDPQEASLGRITKFVPSGLLATAEGEDYINTMQRRDQKVPEDLKKDKLKYKIEIKLLGAVKAIRTNDGKEQVQFVPSQRRLPHLGANVALPSNEVLQELCALSGGDTELGHFSLGEFVYDGQPNNNPESIFRSLQPSLPVKFNINNLVSKRTVVFARAGYGKSNLIKYLVAELYRNEGEQAKTDKGSKVGTLIFDADGEYFWPDHKGRPGLCDVPDLRRQIVVFTSRKARSAYYDSWKAGDVKLDIRELPARDVIGIAISPDRQNQQNVLKLKSLSSSSWRGLVDLIKRDGLQASEDEVGKLMGYDGGSATAEIAAAKSNMYNVVNHLHDPQSQLIHGTLTSLKEGKIVVVDISLLSSTAGYNVAGLLMRRIFNYNQENFTGGSAPIPVNVIIEEAQSVLGKRLEESSPFVEWVKEGRKYDLGGILVTQQPGSMAPEIMSQADNWFSFHLLSEGDASTLGKYNSHFSHDVLAHLIGEPIPGNCFMWSAPKQPFVLPVRVKSFESLYETGVETDPDALAFEDSPAVEIRRKAEEGLEKLAQFLLLQLKHESTILSAQSFPEGDLVGIYYGQLFHLMKQVLAEPDFQDEIRPPDQLYEPILAKIFDCVVVQRTGEHPKKGRKAYYCVPASNWKRVMGST